MQAQQGFCLIVQALPPSVPFRRLPTHARYGEPSSRRIASTAPRPSVSGRSNNAPAHVPIPCFSYAKPSTFHWPRQPLPAHNSMQVTYRTALNRPPTQPTNFTLSHIQSLSSFFSRAPNHLTRQRSMRCFHNPACFTSERRYKVFAERQTALRLVPRFKTVFAQQRSVQFFPRAAASASLEGSQPCAASCFSQPHPRCRPYPTAQANAIWSAMFSTHKPTLRLNASLSHSATSSALVVVPMFRRLQPQSTSPTSHIQRAQRRLSFALASPQPPTRWARARLSPRLPRIGVLRT